MIWCGERGGDIRGGDVRAYDLYSPSCSPPLLPLSHLPPVVVAFSSPHKLSVSSMSSSVAEPLL